MFFIDFILHIYKQLQAITPIRNDIIKSLSLYYYTFVDLLDFKDQVCELLTTMDACQIHLDIVSYITLFSFN
jgi:NCK-associated protein 1